ncbi:MAG TPA: sigma 54-interacting transcriptional regulator [Planctomycetota bacterium]|nr:sigma 54-interacting transcriptional regulator [Planctomycetota bacterium]
MPKIIVVEGPNRGAVLPLPPGTYRMGRDPELELVFPDRSISRRHADLAVDEDGIAVLTDAGSTNATYVNGVRVIEPRTVIHGDELRLGDTTCLFLHECVPGEDLGIGVFGDTSKLQLPPPSPDDASDAVGSTTAMSLRIVRNVQPARYMVGESSQIRRVSELVARCAPLDTTVLVRGESGSGKELVAEALHRLGPRRDGPFIVINCATLEPALLESELFGHERGAFTGAVARKLGKLELAQGGTLFLDEVGELPLAAQAKLLRAVDKRQFQRVGGQQVLTTNARFVAATHRNLPELVRKGDFREDLLFRLNVVEIHVPPLRERPDDIAELIQHFLKELREKIPARARSLTPAALGELTRYRFPGNVRELRNVLERCLIFCEREYIDVADLPSEIRNATIPFEATGKVEALDEKSVGTLEDAEKTQIQRALLVAGWNKSKAAKLLAIDRNTLHSKMKRYNLET